MAYERRMYLEQDKFSYKDFIQVVENIEKCFSLEACKDIRGESVFVTVPPFDMDCFVKTTVSDYHDVVGKINLSCLTKLYRYNNYIILKLQEPKKGDFRGKIKFTPKNTLALSCWVNGCDKPDGNGSYGGVWASWRVPIKQNESFVEQECDALFANDATDAEYDRVAEEAWSCLEYDDRLVAYPKCERKLVAEEDRRELSRCVHYLLCTAVEIHNLSGVVYVYNDVVFIFPMPYERFKEVFKNRDKINGRRRVLPTVVQQHERKGAIVDAHVRSGSNYFTIDNREFTFFYNGDILDQVLKTERQRKRYAKKAAGAEHDDRFLYLE